MDEQGLGARAALPDARLRRRGGAAGRHPGDDGEPLGLQPVARGGLGLRLRGPHLRRADAVARRPRRGGRRGRVAARARRAHRARPARARARPATAPAGRSATRCTTRSGPGWPRRRPGRLPPRRQRLQAPLRRRPGAARATFGFGNSDALGQVLVARPGHPRHHRLAGRPRRLPAAPDAAGGEHRERLRLGRTCWSSTCASRPTRRRGCSRRTRSTPCAATCGSRRTSRRTSRALADLIGVERILFGSDWPHGEGVAQPLDFAKELGGLRRARGAADHARQLRRAPRVRCVSDGNGQGAPRPHAELWDEVTRLARGATGTPTSPSTRGGRRWPTPAGRRRTSPPSRAAGA